MVLEVTYCIKQNSCKLHSLINVGYVMLPLTATNHTDVTEVSQFRNIWETQYFLGHFNVNFTK